MLHVWHLLCLQVVKIYQDFSLAVEAVTKRDRGQGHLAAFPQ